MWRLLMLVLSMSQTFFFNFVYEKLGDQFKKGNYCVFEYYRAPLKKLAIK